MKRGDAMLRIGRRGAIKHLAVGLAAIWIVGIAHPASGVAQTNILVDKPTICRATVEAQTRERVRKAMIAIGKKLTPGQEDALVERETERFLTIAKRHYAVID